MISRLVGHVARALLLLSWATASAFAAAEAPPPPPNAGQAVSEWYVSPAGEPVGPLSMAALIEMARQAKISKETPAWKTGMAEWKLVGDIAELAPVMAAAAAPATVPPPAPQVQTLLNDKLKAFLVGTWRFEGMNSTSGYPMYVTLEITYRADGSYAGMQATSLKGPDGIQVEPTQEARGGGFTLAAIDERNFTLNLIERGRGSMVVNLKIIDENTIEDVSNLNRHRRVR